MIESFLNRLPSLPIILLALSVHETAHGYVAYKLGDPTAHSLGRLTLNPLKHLDPIGFLCMLLFGFGWAKPVPINTRYFKNPRTGMALTGIAGPISNVLLALLFTVALRIYDPLFARMPQSTGRFWLLLAGLFYIFLQLGIRLNLSLAVFNMIPVPPLDGSRFCYVLLPEKWYFGIMKYERVISLVIMLALFFGLLDGPLSWAVNGLMDLLFMLVGW